MVLYDKGGTKRTRSIVEYSKKADPGAYKVLVVFKTPPDLKDVGFLVHARTFSDRHLWAYFPAFKRTCRIPTTSQDDSFFGTDFSYDDFGGPPNLDDYIFRVLKKNKKTGHKTDLSIVRIQYHTKFPDSLFTRASLEKAGR